MLQSPLSEQHIQDSFHSYLKSSLAQAKAERLIDADLLSSAEADLMITGPALCLYFAALRCTTNPPSVPLPRLSKFSPQLDLSPDNCPPAFVSFLNVWAKCVDPIQALAPEHQHDLARIICGLPPLSAAAPLTIEAIAADLRAVAIEISQRRSFQDRYADDLQAALDSGSRTGSDRHTKMASFVPPPSYDPSSPPTSPRQSLDSRSSQSHSRSPSPPPPPPRHQPQLNLHSPSSHRSPRSTRSRPPPSPAPSSPSLSLSPSFLPPSTPAIDIIRETLYAALASVLETHPALVRLLSQDPPRAYFAAVALAILDVACTAVDLPSTPPAAPFADSPDSAGAVIGVLGRRLTLAEAPPELHPFMQELLRIARQAHAFAAADDWRAVDAAQRGDTTGEGGEPRLAEARAMLEGGIGRRSVEGATAVFVNRINTLSLGMTKLRAFRERQGDVFKVLAGVAGGLGGGA